MSEKRALGRVHECGITIAAWSTCLMALAAVTALGFRGIEAWARPIFDARIEELRRVAREFPSGGVVAAVPLSDGVVVRQDFDAFQDGLCGLRLRVVTWQKTPDPYTCAWSLMRHADDQSTPEIVRCGTFSADVARDWEAITLLFEPVSDSAAVRYTFRIKAGSAEGANLVGVPLYASPGGQRNGARVVRRPHPGKAASGHPQVIPSDAVLALQSLYDEPGW